ncbi:histidine kinase [Pedobacter sp. UYP30]|uniref:sensor histidine kinase n=1 Tax=Pedobacter sp. UYP30 TaxID=1756400 RepID=UPI00339248F7
MAVLRYFFAMISLIVVRDPTTINKNFILTNVWRGLYFIGFGTGYFYIKKFAENREVVEELRRKSLLDQIERHSLENSLIQSQNNYLRSQINPHFLFNTLNFIYNDARKKAPVAADAIMNLSEMMRYALKRSEALEVVPITEEIEQIEHLIELHKLRTKNAVNLDFLVEGNLMGVRFPPLVLLTLVENLFKHGNILHPTQPALISLKRQQNILEIKICNVIGPTQQNNDRSHKVGVTNTKTRLENIYKGNCTFNCYINEVKNTYTTEISVDLNFTPKK